MVMRVMNGILLLWTALVAAAEVEDPRDVRSGLDISDSAVTTPIIQEEREIQIHGPHRELYSSSSSSSSSSYGSRFGTNIFADSDFTYYDGYQQAFRMLGFFVDCDANKASCQRYLLWAFYVDLNYQGGGTGEYKYYDPSSYSWDTTACNAHGNGRCAKMDCHDPDTETWTLAGIYKEASFATEWFEQLFKHHSYCLWSSDQYEFMQTYRETWPQSCTQTKVYTKENYNLYIAMKPYNGGRMAFGLYYDSYCRFEYAGTDVDVSSVAASMGYLSGYNLQSFNANLDIYRVCQPCRCYTLSSSKYSYSKSNEKDDHHKEENSGVGSGRWYNSSLDPNEGYFICSDDADHTNVNQCMKFRTHTDMEVATWADLTAASEQGGILPITIGDVTFGQQKMSSSALQSIESERMAIIQEEVAAQQAKKMAMVNERQTAEQTVEVGKNLVGFGTLALAGVAILMIVRRIRAFQGSRNPDLSKPLTMNEKAVQG